LRGKSAIIRLTPEQNQKKEIGRTKNEEKQERKGKKGKKESATKPLDCHDLKKGKK